MNKLFSIVLLTILLLAVSFGIGMALRVGPPIFKILLIGVEICAIWAYIQALKEIKKVKNN